MSALVQKRRATAGDIAPEAGEQDDDRVFLDEVGRFLDENLTPELQAAGRATAGTHSDIDACRNWHDRLYRRGWIAPAWPTAYGGTGWTPRQRLLFDRACAERDAPVLFAGGLRNVGPILIARGTDAQKRRYLHRILSGQDLWCQGYSEAEAGSDLAALRTRAVLQDDHYVVNGRKVWTTGAQHANRMFALVRTSGEGKPQEGITFLLIDMASPGIDVRPIRTMYGEDEFNEVTFDDVRVPAANRVGAENEGWSVAKQLMNFARASNTTTGLLRRTWRMIETLSALVAPEPAERLEMAAVEADLIALERRELAMAAGHHAGDSGDGAFDASMMKILATELHQRITALGVSLAGPEAFARLAPLDAANPLPFAGIKHLATRAATIYSGTNEIHRNVMARGLLDFGRSARG